MTALATAHSRPHTDDVIEFLQELRRELRFSDRLDQYVNEAVKFAVRDPRDGRKAPNPSPSTACWSFRGKPGTHLIHFCLGLFDKMRPGADWQGYVSAYAHHELMHACITMRDLKAANKTLRDNQIPFALWNLFEDARIEARGRAEFGFPMTWLDYEDAKPADKPSAYFFNLIQNKGEDSPALLADTKAPWAPRVRDHFFKEALTANDFEDMLALLKQWIAEFPEDKNSGGSGGGKFTLTTGGATSGSSGEGDLEGGLSLQVDGETFTALLELAEAQQAKAGDDGKSAKASMGVRHSIEPVADGTNDPVVRDHEVREVDSDLARKVSDRLAALLAPTTSRERTAHQSKRISARAFLAGRPDFYRRKVEARNTRPIKIAFFIDCSGSMASVGKGGVSAADGGIAVAMGLNELARRGLVEGYLVLHKGDSSAKCATYAFPLPDEFFARVPSDGAYEAIEPAFQKCAPLCRKADYVFCFTDGHICDARVDKDWLARHGVRPIGLYCGNTELAEPLKEWFACALVRESVLELVEAIVATVDFSQTKRGGRRGADRSHLPTCTTSPRARCGRQSRESRGRMRTRRTMCPQT